MGLSPRSGSSARRLRRVDRANRVVRRLGPHRVGRLAAVPVGEYTCLEETRGYHLSRISWPLLTKLACGATCRIRTS